jgi:antitoxin PrlF
MSEAKVTSNGQITIPADSRKTAGIKPGTRVVVTRLRDGTIVFRAKTLSFKDLKGTLKPPDGVRVSIDEMNLP